MIRILFFLIVVFCLGLGFAWLADRPGDLVITFSGYEYQVTLMLAASALVAIVAAIMISWWVLKSIWNSPRAVNRYFRARRRDRGYQSLSTGLIAAGSGDSGLARKMGKQASGMLSADQEPLLHLLEAQTMLLENRHDEARAKFEQMLEDPETRLLGLRGLYLEAQRLGERDAARHYAEQAAAAAPQLLWASNSAIGTRTAERDWAGALKLLQSQTSTRQISRDEANRRRAVLLTAKAMAEIDTDPAAARSAALEANKLQPDFIPAALAAGRVLFRNDEIRRGTRLLEAIWKKSPHPEIADLYIHARPGDSTHDRLKRARRLESLRRNHVESALAVARAANNAGEFRIARQAIETALRLQPRESAYLLLADIEENETGDQGRVRHWLARAVRAPRDPAWTADGYVSEHWAPVSPITGALGAFEWKVPVERLGAVVEVADDGPAAAIPIMPPPTTRADVADAPASGTRKADEAGQPSGMDEGEQSRTAAEPAGSNADGGKKPRQDQREPEPRIAEAETSESANKSDVSSGDGPDAKEPGLREEEEKEEPVPLHRIPDDPGVDADEATKETPGRFRLF